MDFESLAQSGSNFEDFCKFKDGISISAIFVELRSTNYLSFALPPASKEDSDTFLVPSQHRFRFYSKAVPNQQKGGPVVGMV